VGTASFPSFEHRAYRWQIILTGAQLDQIHTGRNSCRFYRPTPTNHIPPAALRIYDRKRGSGKAICEKRV